jgi:putative ABC transport system substrate-binding protein
MQFFAREIVNLEPDVIIAQSTPAVQALARETKQIPIVFVNVNDPVASGIVSNLSRPDGNITGFTNFEPSMGGKWLQLLSELNPSLKQVGVIFNPETTPGKGMFILPSVQAAAASPGIAVRSFQVRDPDEIGRALAEMAQSPNSGFIALPDTFLSTHRDRLIGQAATHRLPAMYPFRYFVTSGGLISYGVETVGVYRRSAVYADRILRGSKPRDLPVQAPTVFELIINAGTARKLGIPVQASLLARADEIIE